MLRNPLVQLLFSLSKALDLVGGSDFASLRHGLSVCYLSGRLAEQLGLPQTEREQLFYASLIHDLGVSTSTMRRDLVQFEVTQPEPHAERGAALLEKSDLLRPIAPIVRAHHQAFQACNGTCLADIIHLADRVDVTIRKDSRYILHQRDSVLATIHEAGGVFCPQVTEALDIVAQQESFWLDLTSPDLLRRVDRLYRISPVPIDLGVIEQLAEIFAEVIDDKSPFTAQHSRDVTRVALALSERLGFTPGELQEMRIAALLHDLGKLGVDDNILDKPGSLTPDEFAVMKMHTYHTYHLLAEVDGLERMARWGAYHHERLDGRGYPFRVGADELDLGSRIVAVSDVFSALRQARPYRSPMSRDKVITILQNQVVGGALDEGVVQRVIDDYEAFDRLVAR